MIDTHAHLRDWEEKDKETVRHGIGVMYRCGQDGAIEECNPDPPLIDRETVVRRLELADKVIDELGIKFFHAVYIALTDDSKQVEEAIKLYHEFFPHTAGFKLFPKYISEEGRKRAFQILAANGSPGPVQSHCEKDSLLREDLWDPTNPITHTYARPPISEMGGIMFDINGAQQARYEGKLVIAHTSVPGSLGIIEAARKSVGFDILVEGAPHHFVLYDEMMNREDGIGLKMNPPLRTREMQQAMFKALLEGRIDQIGTDHAPHTREEKFEHDHYSGIPGYPLYSVFIQIMKESGMNQEAIDAVTHDNIVKNYGFPEDLIPNTRRAGTQTPAEIKALRREYAVDVVSFLS